MKSAHEPQSSSSSAGICLRREEKDEEESVMNKSLLIACFCFALLSGCVAVPPVPPNGAMPDPSDPAAPQASTRPPRQDLVATTKVYLDPSAGADAQKMEHGNMQGMDGMDHSKMPGMEQKAPPATSPAPQPQQMPQMDHSKMPGMEQKESPAAPPSKEALDGEMKKTEAEMKKLSEELKAKSEAAKSPPQSSPQMQHQLSPANQSQSKVIYTCVMHPEVQSDKPGNCPKCGMKLVPKSAAQ